MLKPYSHPSRPESEKTVRNLLQLIKEYQQPACGYKYIFMGCGDHSNNAHWKCNGADPCPEDPDDLATDCSENHHALFLLLVEEGVFLGANGWHTDYDKPLGAPLGPAYNATDPSNSTRRLLMRKFASGAKIIWDLGAGLGVIQWAGEPVPPPPPVPPAPAPRPPPGPPRPAPPPPPPSKDCEFEANVDFKCGFAHKVIAQSAAECCGACKAFKGGKECVVGVWVAAGGECFLKRTATSKVAAAGRTACVRK